MLRGEYDTPDKNMVVGYAGVFRGCHGGDERQAGLDVRGAGVAEGACPGGGKCSFVGAYPFGVSVRLRSSYYHTGDLTPI